MENLVHTARPVAFQIYRHVLVTRRFHAIHNLCLAFEEFRHQLQRKFEPRQRIVMANSEAPVTKTTEKALRRSNPFQFVYCDWIAIREP